jgi:hypothetical protein
MDGLMDWWMDGWINRWMNERNIYCSCAKHCTRWPTTISWKESSSNATVLNTNLKSSKFISCPCFSYSAATSLKQGWVFRQELEESRFMTMAHSTSFSQRAFSLLWPIQLCAHLLVHLFTLGSLSPWSVPGCMLGQGTKSWSGKSFPSRMLPLYIHSRQGHNSPHQAPNSSYVLRSSWGFSFHFLSTPVSPHLVDTL